MTKLEKYQEILESELRDELIVAIAGGLAKSVRSDMRDASNAELSVMNVENGASFVTWFADAVIEQRRKGLASEETESDPLQA